MIYLICGEDSQAKDKKISEIKSAQLIQPESLFFDFDSLDAQHVNASTLKKSLIALPSFSSKRVILIRHAQKLKADPAQLLASYIDNPSDQCDLILEVSGELKTPLKEAALKTKMFTYGVKVESDIFNMTKLMSARKTTEALKMLNDFYEQGMYPLQMMGALVWYWGKEGRGLGAQRFEQGLKALEEADLNIKRSRLLPEYALEKLVVELVEIQKK